MPAIDSFSGCYVKHGLGPDAECIASRLWDCTRVVDINRVSIKVIDRSVLAEASYRLVVDWECEQELSEVFL